MLLELEPAEQLNFARRRNRRNGAKSSWIHNISPRVVISGDPGSGHSSDPYEQFNPSAFTGKKVWDFPNARTGVLSTAGGSVFTSGAGGLLALDAKSGKPMESQHRERRSDCANDSGFKPPSAPADCNTSLRRH